MPGVGGGCAVGSAPPECRRVCWSLVWSPRCEVVTAAEPWGKEKALPRLLPRSWRRPRARAKSRWHLCPCKSGVPPVVRLWGCDPRVAPRRSPLLCLHRSSPELAAPRPAFARGFQLALLQPSLTHRSRCENSSHQPWQRCVKWSVCLMDITAHLSEPDFFFILFFFFPPNQVLPRSLILRVQFSACK